MVLLTACEGCKQADHSKHYKTVQAAPPEMLGGSECPCTGECEDGRYISSQLPNLLRAIREQFEKRNNGSER